MQVNIDIKSHHTQACNEAKKTTQPRAASFSLTAELVLAAAQ